MLRESVKQHCRGRKEQLEQMLNNATKMLRDKDDEEPPSRSREKMGRPTNYGGKNNNRKQLSRVKRNRRFGFGGQKKRSKRNNKRSNDMF